MNVTKIGNGIFMLLIIALGFVACDKGELETTTLEGELSSKELYSTEMPEGMTLEEAQNEIAKIVEELKKDPAIVKEVEEELQRIKETSSTQRNPPTAQQCARAQLCAVTANPGNVFDIADLQSSIYMRIAYDKNPKNYRLSTQEIVQYMPQNVWWIGFRWVNIEAVDYVEYNFDDFVIGFDCM